jgi:hypothetical protein
MVMVLRLEVVRVIGLPLSVMTWPGVHVETVSVTTWVVMVLVSEATGAGGVLTAAGGVMGMSLGQSVTRPGFCGMKAAQIPWR